jgi:hypothetical protein
MARVRRMTMRTEPSGAPGMTCTTCGNTLLWWRSRTGHRVCLRCDHDPLDALSTLAGGADLLMHPERSEHR